MQNAKVQPDDWSRGPTMPVAVPTMDPLSRARARGWCFRLTFAFCLLPLAAGRADIQAPPKASSKGDRQLDRRIPPPPAAVAAKVRLQPGGSAEIVLHANGALGKTISFLLRTPPAHGSFEGELRRIGRDAVGVTYVHRAADGPGHDSFTFAVQAPGTAVSAADTVDIDVVDTTVATPVPVGLPDLAARPSELDFGAVEAGNFTAATLTVENRGSAPATGQLDPPLPWAVEGETNYNLGPGGRQTFRFVFKPRGEGAFAETLHIDAGKGENTTGCVVRLVGAGLPRTVRPELVLPSPAAPAALAVAAVDVSPAPAPSAGEASPAVAPTSRAGSGNAGRDTVVINQARVTEVKVLAVSSSTVELAWRPPVPLPASYRVESRSFAHDDREAGRVRIDWLPYERVDFRTRADQVTATLRGLAAGGLVTLRIVSVDAAGQLSQPSPLVNFTTAPPAQWWRPTPLKALLLALAVCLGLLIRKRWQERRAPAGDEHRPEPEIPLFTER